jgi:hypothetical protein
LGGVSQVVIKCKIVLLAICCLFPVSAFSQENKARKISEFGRGPCGQLMSLLDGAFVQQLEDPMSKLYVFYYEGKDQVEAVWNNKLKKHEEKVFRTRRGNALNFAREVPLYARGRKFDENKIFLIDGGYRDKATLELWLVPDGAAPPKATPTADEKDIVFGKEKPSAVRDCFHWYDEY